MDSFQDLKDKYRFHSQKQLERAKKANRQSKLSEIAEKSNVKLLTLKKALKTKMDEKKKEKYEKRLLMYKIANEEEEADYEKFFDENESECESNTNSQARSKETDSNDAPRSDKENDNSQDKPEEDDSQQQASGDDECSDEETESQSMDCTPDNLIEQNRDMLTRMINKTQQTQLNNEDLLGLCSAKVASDFIDDECEDDEEDDIMQEEADSEGDSNDEGAEDQLNEEESNEAEKREVNEEEENSNSGFDILRERLKRHRELESDSDDDDYSFANKFKFKKACKIQESDDEEDEKPADLPNSELSFKNKFISQVANEESNSNDNKLSSINGDDLENLNSQDSQFANNRESTFLESRSDVRKTRFNLNDFIEDQAELSEEDKDRVSSDEEEDSNDEYEQEEIEENLPSDEEILKANNKMFMKQQMDEDKRELLEYQERFLEFGDLHDDGEVRQRKFKWKNTDNVWVDNVKESSDSDEFDIDDSQIEYTSMHLKQISEIDKVASNGTMQESQCNEATQSSQASLTKDEKRKKKLMNTSLNKTHLSSYSTFDNSIFSKHLRAFKRNMVSGPANDIKSYIIKDKNLVNAMSVKSSTAVANREKAKQLGARVETLTNKKRKGDKNENKKSIFDLF